MTDEPIPNKPLAELLREWYERTNTEVTMFARPEDDRFQNLCKIAEDLQDWLNYEEGRVYHLEGQVHTLRSALKGVAYWQSENGYYCYDMAHCLKSDDKHHDCEIANKALAATES